MKKIQILMFIVLSYSSFGQSLSVFDVDTTKFPTIKAKFYAWDAANKQITSFSPSDFAVKEDGQPRNVISVSCPAPSPPKALSTVITIDVSGSMSSGNLDNAIEAARAWIQGMPGGGSECCLTSFNHQNFFNQDFTSNKEKLLNGLTTLTASGGTAFNAGFIDPMAGALLAAEKGKHKKVVIFITDGLANGDEQAILNKANSINATVYCITLGMSCPAILQHISKQTGGDWFDNITTLEQVRETYIKIFQTVQSDPCEIEWESGISCVAGLTNVEVKLLTEDIKATTNYQSLAASVAKLVFEPASVKFLKPLVGIQIDTTITVTAENADFNVLNIIVSNASFDINPKSFFLAKGQSKDVKVSFIPADSGYIYCKFEFETDVCPAKFNVSGGWPGKFPVIKTIKLIKPNGREVLLAGKDTTISWEGILEDEPVKIEYTTNKGVDWILIKDNAKGLTYKWRIPKTPSKECLVRVSAKSIYDDVETVELCNQIWMQRNLDVDHYRNGDSIPEIKDDKEWKKLTTGAWCYYNNDAANDSIYGKLYNWYAVNDPRGLAPAGWHVPTDDEWKELEMCLGLTQAEADTLGWRGTDQGAQLAGRADLWEDGVLENHSNFGKSGFSGLPAGFRRVYGDIHEIGQSIIWWSSSEYKSSQAWFHSLSFDYATVSRWDDGKCGGFSVRCVRDK